MSFDLSDYTTVDERITQFNDRYPEGSLQSEVKFTDHGVLCIAWAYRTPDDQRPGIGHSFMQIPGKTPYTLDSEVENAETSARGRAIVALGFLAKNSASAEEVRARTGAEGGSPDGAGVSGGASPKTTSRSAPDSPVAQAQAAAEAAKAARTPNDDGDPKNVEITFGKHAGATLGQVPDGYVKWIVANVEGTTPEKRRLLMAAQELVGAPAQDTYDDVPF